MKLLRRVNLKEIIKFGLVGGINTLLTYLGYSAFVFFGMPYYLALFVIYVITFFFGFIINHHFTFNIKERITLKMLYKMIIVYGILFVLNEGLLFLLVGHYNFTSYAGQAIASVLIAGFSYFLQKIFVFGLGRKK